MQNDIICWFKYPFLHLFYYTTAVRYKVTEICYNLQKFAVQVCQLPKL